MTISTNAFLLPTSLRRSPVKTQLQIVNLVESGFPKPEALCKLLDRVIRHSRKANIPALKLIHGYSSHSNIEFLRFAIRINLHARRRTGRIDNYVTGEKWSKSDEASRELLRRVPDLLMDSDLGRANKGITLVLL